MHVTLEGVRGRYRRLLAPKSVYQAPACQGLIGMQEEEREQRSSLPAPESDRLASPRDLERPEDAERQRVGDCLSPHGTLERVESCS